MSSDTSSYRFPSLNWIIINKLAATGMVVLLSLTTFLSAEEVCKFTYKGQPENLHDSTIIVPEEMVAMSEYIYVGTPKGSIPVQISTPTIFFVIDNSTSMSSTNNPNDQWGNRFNVTRDLVDSLYARFPKAEVGLATFRRYLYFDPTDSDEFVQCPQQDTGAYLPLFRLDSSYAISGGQMGHQILKRWLETDTISGNNTYVDLTYVPSNIASNSRNTNINCGFDAAKHAMLASQYEKACHYVIFLSDGEANYPQGSADAYVQGTDVPTTFTIYFTRTGTPPQELIDFTANVQGNGYSTTNPSSNLWAFENTEYDTLMKFIMDSVVSVIQQTQISYPTGIQVNGSDPIDPWDSTGFTFSDLFPLTGWETLFVYDIDYHIFVDSITPTGDTITVEKDTSTHVEFTVEIEDGAPDLPDTFVVQCWDRVLGFYYQNNQINAVNETMSPLELRFTYDPGDAGYNYTKAEIEFVATSSGDRETYSLSQNGTTFSGNFARVVIEGVSPSPGNGIIENYADDNFVATFRNNESTKLVLDTLQTSVPFQLTGSVEIVCAYYYDNNADGFVDSIHVEATTDIGGGLTDDMVTELLDSAITLPGFRNFTINNSGTVSGGFYIDVTEDNANPTTYVTDEDKLVISDYMLSTGGMIEAAEAPIHDRVAPLIHWDDMSAFLVDFQVDSIDDTLTVKFSENITDVTHSEPFLFLSMEENTQYQAQLSHVSHTDNTMKFTVDGFNSVQYMRDGDSIWIQRTDRVGDNVNPINYQNNNNNTRRKLWVERRMTPYDLIPNTTSPINISNPNSNTIIPTDVIDIINSIDPNFLNNNGIQINNNGDYIGMIITIKPNKDPDIMLPDFKLKGFISIFDAVGNQIVSKEKMLWWEAQKALIWLWNGKNMNDRNVGAGSYLAIAEIEEVTESLGYQNGGPKQVKRIYVGIMQ